MLKEAISSPNKKGQLYCDKVFAELQGTPWTSLSISSLSTPMFAKSKFTDSCYYLIFTDLIRVWYRYSDKNSIKEEKLEFNPQFAATTARILEILKDHFEAQKSDAEYLCHIHPTKKMVLSLSTKIDFYMFQWTFECEPMQDGDDCHSLYIRDHIIIPYIYANKLLSKQSKATPTQPSDNRGILKRSKSSFLKNEEPSNTSSNTTCTLCNQSTLSSPNSGKCCCATDDDIAPLDCMTHPWFDSFTSKAYQRYIAYANKVQTKTPVGTPKDKEREAMTTSMMTMTSDTEGPDTLGTLPLPFDDSSPSQPVLSRYYSKPEMRLTYASTEEDEDELLSKNTRLNTRSNSVVYSSSQESSSLDSGQEENPEEVRRRQEIAERLERERAKKGAVQNKRKRFI